ISPAIGRRLQPESYMEGRQPMRFCWASNEFHAGFIGCTPALLVIASETCGDNIVPAFLSAKRHRYHVIEGQIFGRKFLAAVLTGVIIPRVDIRAGKLYAVMILHPDVLQEADDRGELDSESNRVNLLVVLFDHFHFSREEQR